MPVVDFSVNTNNGFKEAMIVVIVMIVIIVAGLVVIAIIDS